MSSDIEKLIYFVDNIACAYESDHHYSREKIHLTSAFKTKWTATLSVNFIENKLKVCFELTGYDDNSLDYASLRPKKHTENVLKKLIEIIQFSTNNNDFLINGKSLKLILSLQDSLNHNIQDSNTYFLDPKDLTFSIFKEQKIESLIKGKLEKSSNHNRLFYYDKEKSLTKLSDAAKDFETCYWSILTNRGSLKHVPAELRSEELVMSFFQQNNNKYKVSIDNIKSIPKNLQQKVLDFLVISQGSYLYGFSKKLWTKENLLKASVKMYSSHYLENKKHIQELIEHAEGHYSDDILFLDQFFNNLIYDFYNFIYIKKAKGIHYYNALKKHCNSVLSSNADSKFILTKAIETMENDNLVKELSDLIGSFPYLIEFSNSFNFIDENFIKKWIRHNDLTFLKNKKGEIFNFKDDNSRKLLIENVEHLKSLNIFHNLLYRYHVNNATINFTYNEILNLFEKLKKHITEKTEREFTTLFYTLNKDEKLFLFKEITKNIRTLTNFWFDFIKFEDKDYSIFNDFCLKDDKINMTTLLDNFVFLGNKRFKLCFIAYQMSQDEIDSLDQNKDYSDPDKNFIKNFYKEKQLKLLSLI